MSREIINYTGRQFGRFLVLSLDSDRTCRGRTWWLCRCECGTEKSLDISNLKRGKPKSCGCKKSFDISKANMLPHGEAHINLAFIQYKQRAKRGDLLWELTKERFKEFITSDCVYCGSEPIVGIYTRTFHNGAIPMNGIDRLDSEKGYTEINCVSCCRICNFMKKELSYNKFIEHVAKIHNYIALGDHS